MDTLTELRLIALVSLASALPVQAQVVPMGPEFAISQDPGFENPPAAATAADGSFLVAWRRTLGRSEPEALIVRLFDAAGNPIVDEFEITREGNQGPAVAAGPRGRYLVAWSTSNAIWAQQVSAEGELLSDAVRLAGGAPGEVFEEDGSGLAIDFLTDGGAVVAWKTSRASSDFVEARLLSSDGHPVGETISVSEPPSKPLFGSFIRATDAAALADGGFVVVWDRFDLPFEGRNRFPNLGRRFSAAGQALGDPFRLNRRVHKFAELPAVIGLPRGGFLVAWRRGLTLRLDQRVFTRRFRSSGQANRVRRVSRKRLFLVGAPKIAVSRDRVPVVVWDEWEGKRDEDGLDVIARSLTKKGRLPKEQGQVQLNTTTTQGQYDPTIVAGAEDSLLAIWEDDQIPGTPRPIVGRFLSASP